MRVRVADVVERAAFDRELAAHQVVEQDTETVQVALRAWGVALEHLRRQIQRCALQVRGALRSGTHDRGGAKIHQDDTPARFPHHILRLDVAVEKPGLVHGGKRAAQVEPEHHRFLSAERPLLFHDVFQRPSVDQLHPEADAVVEAIDAENRDDIGVANPGEQASLLEGGIVANEGSVMQKLEREVSLEPGFPGPKDRAETAAADLLRGWSRGPRTPVAACLASSMGEAGSTFDSAEGLAGGVVASASPSPRKTVTTRARMRNC